MKNIIAPLFGLMVFLSSCEKVNFDDLEYFAFGDAHGFCAGNCTNFFMIKDNNVYPDDMDRYIEPLEFKSAALPAEKYYLAKKLIRTFPSYLMDNPDKTFGCPDCADQGGIHIEIKENGQTMKWHFDTNISNLPEAIQDYVKEVSDVINQLK